MAAGGSARSRRPPAAKSKPLTEAQLAEVRRTALAMRGAGRSVKQHGVIVFLDRTSSGSQLASKPAPMPARDTQASAGAATARPPADGLNARQRRSRRRLEARIAQRAADAMQTERPPQPQGGDGGLAAMRAAMQRVQGAAASSSAPNPSCPAPRPPGVPASTYVSWAQKAAGRAATDHAGGRARGESGTGRPNAAAQPKPARAKQPSSAGKQPAFVFGAYQSDSACGKGPLPCASGGAETGPRSAAALNAPARPGAGGHSGGFRPGWGG
jgi:hypothetical protein